MSHSPLPTQRLDEEAPPAAYGTFRMDDVKRALLLPETQKNSYLGEACFIGSLLIFSQIPAVAQTLFRTDPTLFTACSILCASNMVGCVVFPLVFYKDLTLEKLAKVSKREWVSLAASALLYSAVGPSLQLTALKYSSVATMAVVQRLESVNLILYAALFTTKTISTWCRVNTLLIVSCVVVYMLVAVEGMGDLTGPIYTVLSGWAYSTSLVLTKELKTVSVGQVAVGRAILGTIAYHIMMAAMGNVEEGVEMMYSYALWRVMLWYGLLYVFLGQYLWTIALKECSPVTLSAGVTALFPLQIFWSVVILGTQPTPSQQYVAMALVLIVTSCAAEVIHNPPIEPPRKHTTADQLHIKGI